MKRHSVGVIVGLIFWSVALAQNLYVTSCAKNSIVWKGSQDYLSYGILMAWTRLEREAFTGLSSAVVRVECNDANGEQLTVLLVQSESQAKDAFQDAVVQRAMRQQWVMVGVPFKLDIAFFQEMYSAILELAGTKGGLETPRVLTLLSTFYIFSGARGTFENRSQGLLRSDRAELRVVVCPWCEGAILTDAYFAGPSQKWVRFGPLKLSPQGSYLGFPVKKNDPDHRAFLQWIGLRY